MPQSFGVIYLHVVFSTKNRAAILSPELHTELAQYITPILKDHRAKLIREGGMPDHVHLLIDLGREVSVATILREIKSKSSQWIASRLSGEFSWQTGYGVFSVSPTHLRNVIHYIDNQESHHLKKTFQQEFQ